ncbi:MAG TPA: hypothetical protein VHT70_00310 [Candidatus Saccharimonadales bacterium]|jgi:hypothetical protein|nr:hypothetical protein [Candidatus Saccharimonadales bacterium]
MPQERLPDNFQGPEKDYGLTDDLTERTGDITAARRRLLGRACAADAGVVPPPASEGAPISEAGSPDAPEQQGHQDIEDPYSNRAYLGELPPPLQPRDGGQFIDYF